MNKKSLALTALLLILAACGSPSNNASSTSGTPSASNGVHISFVYSTEAQPWLDAATKAFNASGAKTAAGQAITVDAKPLGSGEIINDILAGTEQPTLWSPSSSLSISLLNDAWIQKQGRNLINETCPSAAYSPLVIMMWKPEAQALGWPQKDIGWADIEQLAANAQTSPFRFGHTDPTYSDSGLQTVLAMAYAAKGQPSRLTVADVQDPKTSDFMSKLEGSVAHYGSSTVLFDNEMVSRGTSDLSASVVYESDVINTYNSGTPTQAPLVAIYPKEGTLLADYPLCILDASWVTSEQEEAAAIFRNYLLSTPAQQQALQAGFRPAETDIPLGAPIDSAHGADPSQPQNILPSPDVSTLQAVTKLWQADKRQVNLTLLVDKSGSMLDDKKLQAAQTALSSFIDQLDPSDTLSLIAFDDQPHVLIDSQNVGNDRGTMKQAVAGLTADGGTALYDAIDSAVKNMKADPSKINTVIVLSDINDTGSQQVATLDKLLADVTPTAESNGISVFTIGYGTESDVVTLQKIAQQLHGTYSAASTTTIGATYQALAAYFQ